MLFRNISSNTSTFCCNKHNKHFTVTHNTHPFWSKNSHSVILFAASLCTFIRSIKDATLIFSVCCHPYFKTKTITTYIFLDSFNISGAFLNSNLSSIPQGFTEIHTVCHVGDDNRCEKYNLYRVTKTHCLTGLCSTQVQVEGIVLKGELHWNSNRSVLNDTLREADHTQFYVSLTFMWCSVGGDPMFFARFVVELLNNWGL